METDHPEIELTSVSESRKKRSTIVVSVFVTLFFSGLWFLFLISPPNSFVAQTTINIESGLSATEIATLAADSGLVRSETLLYAILVLFHDPSSIQAGTYVFSEPLSTLDLADKLANDVPEAVTVAVTFPEGYSNKDYAKIASKTLPTFDSVEFLELASTSEGYLFPDTYFVPPDFTARDFFKLLQTTYQEQTLSLRSELDNNKLSEEDIIILASILEREANSENSMKIVAGILDSRLVLGMPLQVDATMEYVLDKPLSQLEPEDLEIDSPYNTYLNSGLPPTPIGNPGLAAIRAVLEPLPTDYLFYITDENGDFYYAKNFEEHKQNIARYLQ